MKTLLKIFFILLATSSATGITYAQSTLAYTSPYKVYEDAQDLFDKEKYSSAQDKFKEVITLFTDVEDAIKIDAEYYYALCALELFHEDAEYLLTQFAVNHPDHAKAQRVYFLLGEQKYRLKKFKAVIEYFEKVDPYFLSDLEKIEYEFKLAYSYFYLKQYDKAKIHFAEIKDISSAYQIPAIYYFSHIAYTEGNYQTALNGFKAISDAEMFKNIVPYYVAQIYHKQGKFKELTDYAPAYFENISKKRKAEFAKLIGDAYYHQRMYKDAIPYLKEFKKRAKSDRISNYQLANSYYKIHDCENAIKNFKPVVTKRDSLSQVALYQLADCFLKEGDKPEARNAFQSASKLHFNPEIQENALFNYAKLAYETNGPYSESTQAFLEYIDKYPNSDQLDEAYEFLIKAYMTTKDYDRALQSIEQIKKKDYRVKKAYQNIAYNRGVELFLNHQYDEAIQKFNQSLKYPTDKKINASALYWMGESFYKKGDYDNAINKYVEFRLEPGSALTNVYRDADYSVAYAYFMKAKPFKNGELNKSSINTTDRKQNLEKAITAFRNFIQLKDRVDKDKLQDAYLRLADAYYLLPDDKRAVENYTKAIEIGKGDLSYAYFQKAKSQGLLGDNKGKAQTLKELTERHPNSTYQILSLRELAQSYQQQGENEKAKEVYKDFIRNYPNNKYVPEMTVNLAGIYVREKNYTEARKYINKVLNDYPSATVENESAIALMKSVFEGEDNLPGYYDWLQQRGIQVATSEIDSALWEPVFNAWNKGDCNAIEKEAKIYLQKVPNGKNAIDAHFYLANCLYTTTQDEALEHYLAVIAQPNNDDYEEALLYGGQIYFAKGDYANAVKLFSELEKVAGSAENIKSAIMKQMVAYWKLKDYPNAITYADKVLNLDGIDDNTKTEALRIKGLSLRETKQFDEAIDVLRACNKSTKSIKGAEAKYYVAEILFEQNKNEECELEIMELVNQKPSYDYWIAKAIILLGDNFIAQKDYYNARASLQSVIDNYQGKDKQEIKQLARDRIEYIDALEKVENTQKDQEENIEELDLNHQ